MGFDSAQKSGRKGESERVLSLCNERLGLLFTVTPASSPRCPPATTASLHLQSQTAAQRASKPSIVAFLTSGSATHRLPRPPPLPSAAGRFSRFLNENRSTLGLKPSPPAKILQHQRPRSSAPPSLNKLAYPLHRLLTSTCPSLTRSSTHQARREVRQSPRPWHLEYLSPPHNFPQQHPHQPSNHPRSVFTTPNSSPPSLLTRH